MARHKINIGAEHIDVAPIKISTKLNENDGCTSRYTTTQIVKALCENAGVLALAAKALGCERGTLWYRCKNNPQIMEIVDEYREAIIDYAEDGLRQAVTNREPWAIQFALRMRGAKRGYSERFEVTGKDGQPLLGGHEAVKEVFGRIETGQQPSALPN